MRPVDTVQIISEHNCIKPLNFDDLKTIIPKYQTNSNSFLVPILIWGPNNQVFKLFNLFLLFKNRFYFGTNHINQMDYL